MSFQSFGFLAFLAVTCAVCVGVGRNRPAAGKVLLTAACIVFYLLEPRGLPGLAVLAVGILVTAWTARQLPHAHHRRRLLAAACAWHIAVLAVFKYTGFFTGGVVSVSWAPAGLSFQQLGYLKTVADGSYVPRRGDGLVLYGLFFPTVTSGPILKPQGFFDQLAPGGKFLHPTWQDVSAGLYALCCGMVKKVLLADAFGVIVDNGWARVGELSAPAAWLVILGYTLQLYFDFSGYCDMATGVGLMFNIKIPINFNSPYKSLNIREFWQRWHITLSRFLTSYIYFPLGGSRKGMARTCVNLMIVFLLSGLWHGAGWLFLLWGLMHGAASVLYRLFRKPYDRLHPALQWLVNFGFIVVAWVFFRATSLTDALAIVKSMLMMNFGPLRDSITSAFALPGGFHEGYNAIYMMIWYAASLFACLGLRNTYEKTMDFHPTLCNALTTVLMIVYCTLSLSSVSVFLYFNF